MGGEESGPLDEIEFWRSRSVDLSGIRTQLDDPAGAARLALGAWGAAWVCGPAACGARARGCARARAFLHTQTVRTRTHTHTPLLLLSLCPAVGQIVLVLEHATSSYLAPFLDLRNLIHRCAHAAHAAHAAHTLRARAGRAHVRMEAPRGYATHPRAHECRWRSHAAPPCARTHTPPWLRACAPSHASCV